MLRNRYGSPRAVVLYCSVDPEHYFPSALDPMWLAGYLGTYSADRQPTLERLLLEPARHLAQEQFVVAGPQYPQELLWAHNVERIEHLAPAQHCEFYNRQRFTLNVTRADMVAAGHSPSVRLFEAAACATPIISDAWDGLDELFILGEEILVAADPREALEILTTLPPKRAAQIGAAGRARILSNHSAAHRALELENHLVGVVVGEVSLI